MDPELELHPSREQANAPVLRVSAERRVVKITLDFVLNIISCSLNIKLFEAVKLNYTVKIRHSRTFEWYGLDEI